MYAHGDGATSIAAAESPNDRSQPVLSLNPNNFQESSMAKRGRKSAAELAIVTTLSDERPDAPYDLTDVQAGIWRGIVDRLPADYFPAESFEMLAAYCRHVTAARALAVEIDRYEQSWLRDAEGLDRYGKLLAMRDREVRGILAVSRALRLTNQSRYRPESAAAKARGNSALWKRPWEPAE
jgi:hypothetical protein